MPFRLPSWPASLRAAGSHESSVNLSGQHVMGLSEFHDTLLLIVLHFSGEIGDGSSYSEISLIRRRRHCFCLYLHSHHVLVMDDLLDNFLNPLKLFWAVS
jgi:hypothetical protein